MKRRLQYTLGFWKKVIAEEGRMTEEVGNVAVYLTVSSDGLWK